MPKRPTVSAPLLPPETSAPKTSGPETTAPTTPDDNPLLALEADARDSIAKALQLFENGEQAVAEHMFERLRQRVLQAGPVAMLISGSDIDSAEERADLQFVVNAIADVARAKPKEDEGDDASPDL